ncbi:MAG: FtsX-like permease family protein [Methanomicrobium sp.]|nr:FtsX-like permease family protein [Methanomicrobium sp.]
MLDDLRVSLFLAVRATKRGGTGRLFMNIFIIALVLTNMIFLPSIIVGSIEIFNQQNIDYLTSDIVIEPREDDMYIENLDELMPGLNRIPGVVRASAWYESPASIQLEEESVTIGITAIDPRDEQEVTKFHEVMKEGNYLGSGDMDSIIIGRLVAGEKDKTGDFYPSLGGAEVGDTVIVDYSNGVVREYRIKGIFNTKSWTADYMAIVTWDEMNSVLGYENNVADKVLVKTSQNADDVDAVRRNILEFGIGEDVKTWEESLPDAVTESVESFNIINQISVAGSLLIAVVLIFIMTTIRAFNNRKQIGILKAIGIKKSVIINSYVIQVIFLCLIGSLLGYLMLEMMTAYFTAYPMEFPDGDVIPIVDYGAVVENTVLLFVSSAIAGYIPAWRITRENILDAMRGA